MIEDGAAETLKGRSQGVSVHHVRFDEGDGILTPEEEMVHHHSFPERDAVVGEEMLEVQATDGGQSHPEPVEDVWVQTVAIAMVSIVKVHV
ncbi:MAG: hypothetical protein GY696_35905 [Gammaproteobacteria bacterium]|nr:hypothetical protein [Gammaproteobacteria bacterium]